MTNLITLTIPKNDHVALRAFGKALEEMALAHGAEPCKTTVGELNYKINIDTTEATAVLEELSQKLPEIDTTAQQVESLADGDKFNVLKISQQCEVPQIISEDVDIDGNHIGYSSLAPTTDNSGTPWDERIHSASKALNADGTWRLRRKPKDMDESEWAAPVESVKAELTHAMESFDEQVIMEEDSQQKEQHSLADSEFVVDPYDTYEEGELPPEPPVTPPGDDFHTDAGVVTEQAVVGIPPIPVPPPVVVPPVPVADESWDFPKLMKFLTERHGKIDVPTVNQLLAVDGLAALTDLNAHPDKIGPFVARVKAHLGE